LSSPSNSWGRGWCHPSVAFAPRRVRLRDGLNPREWADFLELIALKNEAFSGRSLPETREGESRCEDVTPRPVWGSWSRRVVRVALG
jgi:hypothetical protein